jgi:hypothetical protein
VQADVAHLHDETAALAVALHGVKAAPQAAVRLETLIAAAAQLRDALGSHAQAEAATATLGEAHEALAKARALVVAGKPAQAEPLVATAAARLKTGLALTARSIERIAYLERLVAETGRQLDQAVNLLARQIAVRERTEAGGSGTELATDQAALADETQIYAELLVQDDIRAHFAKALAAMTTARQALRRGAMAAAVPAQREAEAALRAGMQGLHQWMLAMQALAQQLAAEPPEAQPAPTMLDAGQQALFLAMQEEALRLEWTAATARWDSTWAERQEGILAQTRLFAERLGATTIPGGDHLTAAATAMDEAIAGLRARREQVPGERMRTAELALRRALATMVVALHTPPEETTTAEEAAEPTEPVEEQIKLLPPDPQGDWHVFLAGTPAGAQVARTASDWESLGEREREALNRNFARELPLEYQDLLKAYYDTLSR